MEDLHTDTAARRLFDAAASTIPPGSDPLGGIRRRLARRRRRTRVALSVGVAAVVAVSLLVVFTGRLTAAPQSAEASRFATPQHTGARAAPSAGGLQPTGASASTGAPQPTGAPASTGTPSRGETPSSAGTPSPGGTPSSGGAPPPGGAQMVLAALNNSVGQSFQVTAMSDVGPPPGPVAPFQVTELTGEFDPAHETGEGTWTFGSGQYQSEQFRWVGGYLYTQYPPVPAGDPRSPSEWVSEPATLHVASPTLPWQALELLAEFMGQQVNPQYLVSLITSPGTVTYEGPAVSRVPGNSWNGTTWQIAKTVKAANGSSYRVTTLVIIDQQGRIRMLDAEDTFEGSVLPWHEFAIRETFSDFGTPVSVTPPAPAGHAAAS
jgi:hypothetical protein